MATSHNPKVITDSLVLSLDARDKNSYPGSGTTWYDLCGNNDTTISGATYNAAGYFTLDGGNDYFQVTTDGRANFAVQEFTIEFWCYVVPNGTYEVLWSYDYISHNSPYYSQHFRTVTDDDTLYFGSNNNGSWDSSGTVWDEVSYTPNKWTQLVFTMKDSTSGQTKKTGKLYQDGVILQSEAFPNTPFGGWNTVQYYQQEVWIGRSNFNTGYYKGNIASVKFYENTLSGDDIKQNFDAQRNRYGI
tara:strand:- start:818 stop:1552 length:735 start_codon:yes stop_codon:yes gene_type:complete